MEASRRKAVSFVFSLIALPALCEWAIESALIPSAPLGNAGTSVSLGEGWTATGCPTAGKRLTA